MRAKKKFSSDWWPMQELEDDRAMLVLVRHGQSEWNFANRFIGWYDSPLTEAGENEAIDAGQLLRDHMIEVDEVHTSMLTRTMSTARLAMGVMREAGLSVPKDEGIRSTWRLNERSYGALTGRNKKTCAREYGKEQLKLFRRSWDVPPPQYEEGCDLYRQETEAFVNKVEDLSHQGLFDPDEDPPPDAIPRGESLKCTQERLAPYWEGTLLPSLQQGKRVMVFGHENNLRALVKLIDEISENDILEVDIPRAMPLVYMFERSSLLRTAGGAQRLQPVHLTPEDAADGSKLLSARYLVESKLIAAFHQRDLMNVYDTDVEDNLEEVCVVDMEMPESIDMCETIGDFFQDDPDSFGKTEIVTRGSSRRDAPGEAFVSMLPSSARSRPAMLPDAVRAKQGSAALQQTGSALHHAAARPPPPAAGASLSLGLLALGGFLAGVVHARKSRVRRQLSRGMQQTRWWGGWPKAAAVLTSSNSSAESELVPEDYFNFDVEDHNDEIVQGQSDEAEEEICELLGYDLGDTLIRQIGKNFNEEELHDAYGRCGYHSAASSTLPQAIWLIGPSASGKSTLAPIIAEWVGIKDEGYVLVDGEFFRDSHNGYQEALAVGKQNGCVWWGAYVGIRENVNKEKQELLHTSVGNSKHLVIPSTCLRKSQCVDVAHMLLENKYVLHIVGIYGSKEEIARRGRKRAKEKGKRYDPREFALALKQFAPMLRLCNGQYRLVCTTDGKDRWTAAHEGSGPLPEAEIKRICTAVFEKYCAEEEPLAS